MENKFKAINEYGKEIECEVLLNCHLFQTGKDYLVYTDHKKTFFGRTKVYASSYTQCGNDYVLHPVTTDEEMEYIESILKTMQSEAKRGRL